jgi:hypothetical protein
LNCDSFVVTNIVAPGNAPGFRAAPITGDHDDEAGYFEIKIELSGEGFSQGATESE